MAVTAAMVKVLRERTGAPMMDCKKALDATDGNVDEAVKWLREKGVTKAAKKASRKQSEGLIGSYIHTNGKVGVIVELSCETDFCAKNEDFGVALKDICMHVAAADPAPLSVLASDLPADLMTAERSIYEEQAKESGKPEQFWPKIVEGRMRKFIAERALLEQPFVKNPDQKVGDILTDLVAKLSENISIRRFTKFRVGE